MRAHLRGIDHAVIVVRDLDRAREAYARMGFSLTPRGHHSLGSQNHCIMFERDYLELMSVPRPHPALQAFSDFVARGDGLGAVALATDDAAALGASLAADGVAVRAPVDFSRPVAALGDARFRILQLEPDASRGCIVFACQHFTPDLVWRDEYGSHAVGALGIAALAVVADDVPGAARGFGAIAGGAPEAIEEGELVRTGGAPIAFASRRELGHRLHGVALPARPGPLVAALFVRVGDRARAAATLRRNGLAPVALRDGSFAVHADAAHGVALVFG